jgi:hypothetical protein
VSSYANKLRDVRWQKKRLDVLQGHGWQCDECCSSEVELQVHHYWYETGLNPWDYEERCYGVLCDKCHTQWHAAKLEFDKIMAGMLSTNMEQANGLLAGLSLIVNSQDFFVSKQTEPIFVSGLVRGFWPPNELQKELLDLCLEKMAFGHEFYFSDVVNDVTPFDHEYQFIHDWVGRVSRRTEVATD